MPGQWSVIRAADGKKQSTTLGCPTRCLRLVEVLDPTPILGQVIEEAEEQGSHEASEEWQELELGLRIEFVHVDQGRPTGRRPSLLFGRG